MRDSGLVVDLRAWRAVSDTLHAVVTAGFGSVTLARPHGLAIRRRQVEAELAARRRLLDEALGRLRVLLH